MEYVVKNNEYKTVKDVLQKEFKFSKRLILKLKLENRIYVNGTPQFVNFEIFPNDVIKVDLNFEEICDNIVPLKMNLDIVFEDDYLIILNKPAGIETHPTAFNPTATLSNGLKYYFNTINLKRKIRPVYRLDKDTSGLLVACKNDFAHQSLSEQFFNKSVKR